jgi:hypothetical protein
MSNALSLAWLRHLRDRWTRPQRRPARVRRHCPQLESLEMRVTPQYTPAQVIQAYGINHVLYGGVVGNGTGQTIAIIDPGDDAALVNSSAGNFTASDLHQFDQLVGLSDPPSFQIVGEIGGARPSYIGIASATVAGTTVTVTTTSAHGLSVGNTVTIAETGNGGLDGSYKVVSVPTSTSFTYTDKNSGLSNVSTGTINNPVSTGETTLDVEWSHAIAPGANIVLIELTNGLQGADVVNAITKAVPAVSASVVSMSFSFGEFSGETGTSTTSFDDGIFNASGVTYIASTGDNGTPAGYPSLSPDVLAVGGSNLFLNGDNSYQSETAWSNPVITSATEVGNTVTITVSSSTPTNFSVGTGVTVSGVGVAGYNGSFTIASASGSTYTYTDGVSGLAASSGGTVVGANNGGSGGSISKYETPQPGYQQGTVTQVTQSTTFRTVPDVAFIGGEPTPVLTYDSDGTAAAFSGGFEFNTWGTSVSAPCWAGLIAIADQGLALRSQPLLNTSVSNGATLQTALYDLSLTDFHDVTFGNNGNAAGVGYDLVTGIGTPVANLLVPDLAGQPAQIVYAVPDTVNNHNIVVKQVGTNIDVFDNGTLVSAHPVSTTTQLDIDGDDASGTITLTVDFSGGQFTIPVSYDGGTASGLHTLIIKAGTFTNEADAPSGINSGTISLDAESITYAHLRPIIDTATATNFTINDPLANDTINVIDDPTTPHSGFTTTQVNGGGFELVDFANKTNVTFNDNGGGGTFNIQDPSPEVALATVNLDATAGPGDTFIVVTPLPGSVSLNVSGFGSNNTLAGPNLAETWNITGANAGNIPGVVASFTHVQILLGNNTGDTFVFAVGASVGTVEGGSVASVETIEGANQNDTWKITGPNAGSILRNGVTLITTFFGIGTLDGNVANDAFVFQSGVGAKIIQINGGGGAGSDSITGPNQNDAWDIAGSSAGNIPGVLGSFTHVANLIGGTANDTFLFAAAATMGSISGGGGNDTISGANQNDTWNILGADSGNIAGVLGSFTQIANLIGGLANDNFLFATAGRMGTINGGGGTDVIVAGPNETNTFNLTGANAGNIAGILTAFSKIPYLAGSSQAGNTGVDVFVFQVGGGLSGRIVGGTGKEWLDYAPGSLPVHVNLTTGTASFLALGVVNVPNVIGSGVGGDTIVGSAAGGVLEGHDAGNTILAGSGRTVIIGGYGRNLLEGGASDDLIIAGSTVFDANIAALNALAAEWQSANAFATRISDLRTGAGMAAGNKLILNATVFVPPTPPGPRYGRGGGTGSSTMLGNGGDNWFFTLFATTIIDLKATDVVD